MMQNFFLDILPHLVQAAYTKTYTRSLFTELHHVRCQETSTNTTGSEKDAILRHTTATHTYTAVVVGCSQVVSEINEKRYDLISLTVTDALAQQLTCLNVSEEDIECYLAKKCDQVWIRIRCDQEKVWNIPELVLLMETTMRLLPFTLSDPIVSLDKVRMPYLLIGTPIVFAILNAEHVAADVKLYTNTELLVGEWLGVKKGDLKYDGLTTDASLIVHDATPISKTSNLIRSEIKLNSTCQSHIKSKNTSDLSDSVPVLTKIWRKYLQLKEDPVPTSNFFSLGGHSLLAMSMRQEITEALGKKVSLRALFQHPTISSLSQFIDSQPFSTSPSAPEKLKNELVKNFHPRVIFLLEPLLRAMLLSPNSSVMQSAYEYTDVIHIKNYSKGNKTLRNAWNKCLMRHNTLRTRFVVIEKTLSHEFWSGTECFVVTTSSRDIEEPTSVFEQPTIRVSFEGSALRVTTSHLVTDGRSLSVLARNFAAFLRHDEQMVEQTIDQNRKLRTDRYLRFVKKLNEKKVKKHTVTRKFWESKLVGYTYNPLDKDCSRDVSQTFAAEEVEENFEGIGTLVQR